MSAAQFKGKVAIVTGSSSGLGEAIALLFASRGASVTLCGRNEERLKAVLDKAVKANGGHKDRVLIVQGELTDKNVRKQIVGQTVAKFGRLDILVANAGISGDKGLVEEITEDDYDNIFNTNVKSVFFLIQEALHLQKARGNVVTISSIAAVMANPNASVYSMSKAALDNLTRCLAVDLGAKGIRVNTVNPGFFQTLLLRGYGDAADLNSQPHKAEENKCILAGRNGVTNDVAEAVAFLASDAAGFVTGEFLKVDGGRYCTGPFAVGELL